MCAQIKALSQDIQEASEVATGRIQLGIYELHDLVQIKYVIILLCRLPYSRETVGVIVKVERDSFKILDNTGNIQTVKLQEMGTKKSSKYATAFDSRSNTINIDDIVNVVDGPHKGRQGTVKHLYRSFAFLHTRDLLENSGIFVVRAVHCAVLGGTKSKGNDHSLSQVPMSPGRALRSPARAAMTTAGTGFQANINRRRKRDEFMDQTVVITRGQWKGYVGIVREATDSTLRVELHTNSKKVNVPREGCKLKDQAPDMDDPAARSKVPSWDPTRTPQRDDIMATPMRVPGTPLRGSATPLRVPGTPVHGTAWDPSMPNTPMRTPTWDTDYSGSSSSSWTPSTPGSGYQPSNFTPYSPARSSDRTPESISSHNPATPSSGLYTPIDQRTPLDSTPYGNYNPNTPGTPNTPGPHGPTTPRGPTTPQIPSEESSAERFGWVHRNVEVVIMGDKYRDRHAYITDVYSDRVVKLELKSGMGLYVVTNV